MTLLNANYLVALQQVNSYISRHYSKVLMVENQDAKAILLETVYKQITTLIDCIMVGSQADHQQESERNHNEPNAAPTGEQ